AFLVVDLVHVGDAQVAVLVGLDGRIQLAARRAARPGAHALLDLDAARRGLGRDGGLLALGLAGGVGAWLGGLLFLHRHSSFMFNSAAVAPWVLRVVPRAGANAGDRPPGRRVHCN